MLIRRSAILTVLLFILSAAAVLEFAQNVTDAVARVPELESFHEVIFKIWHEAYPDKDIALLQQLLPEVEEGISKVAAAKLPGILRGKKAVWEEGIQKLQSAGKDYKAAVSSKDEAKMLAAAEELHSRFAMLRRSIQPALKELDDFHSVLYMLYHHYLPQYDLEKIRLSVGELKQKMTALNAVQVPLRLKDNASEFEAARSKLSASVDALESSLQTNSEEKIKAAVETMHSDYQALNGVFE
jgi:NADH dehydrogenase/NADH:ubiquinone oxidoreductase subunit G